MELGSYADASFLYNGQYGVMSDDNGLYYMRARYYNIDIKRFINQDVVIGSIASSTSLNRYAYVEGNPVSYLDPFGLWKKNVENVHSWVSSFLTYVSATVSVVKWLVAATGNIAAFSALNTLDKILSKVEFVSEIVDLVLAVFNGEEWDSILTRAVTILAVTVVDSLFTNKITSAVTGEKALDTLTKVERVAYNMYISTYDMLYSGISYAVQYLIENAK